MAETKDIHEFAQNYLRIFTDSNPPSNMLEHAFAQGCYGLGFHMDLGDEFMRLYPEDAFYDSSEFVKIAPSITDPDVLGTAIFSRWRLVTHWEEESVMSEDKRAWFIAALGRLAEITDEEGAESDTFTGKLASIRIMSSDVSTAHRPVLGEETEQVLTMTSGGKIMYALTRPKGDPGGHRVIMSEPAFKIEQQDVSEIFRAIHAAFPYVYRATQQDIEQPAPAGTWKLILTNERGRSYRTIGDLGARILVDGEDLSDIIRERVGKNNLLLFDGNPDLVSRLEVRYRRGVPVKKGDKKGGGDKAEADTNVRWEYAEQIVFDREKESIDHVLDAGAGHRSRTRAYVHGAIAEFLDLLDPATGFAQPVGNPDDVVYPRNEITEYQIILFTKYGNTKVFSGTYDQKSLPPEWNVFIDQLLTFLGYYEYGELFDEARYGRAIRRESDNTYLLVAFDDNEPPIWYLSDDPEIIDSDAVLVPHGAGTRIGIVQQVIFGDETQAPASYNHLRRILRKCTSEDLQEAGEKERKKTSSSAS